MNLGVFSSVEITEDRVTPRIGDGAAQGAWCARRSFAPYASAAARASTCSGSRPTFSIGWEDRNFLGGMRNFSVEARPGVTFFPTRLDDFRPRRRTCSQVEGARTELRQPSFIEGRTTGFVAGEYNIYPGALPAARGCASGRRADHRLPEFKAQTGVERAFFGQHLLRHAFVQLAGELSVSVPEAASRRPRSDPRFVSRALHGARFPRRSHSDRSAASTFSNQLQVAGYIFFRAR